MIHESRTNTSYTILSSMHSCHFENGTSALYSKFVLNTRVLVPCTSDSEYISIQVVVKGALILYSEHLYAIRDISCFEF